MSLVITEFIKPFVTYRTVMSVFTCMHTHVCSQATTACKCVFTYGTHIRFFSSVPHHVTVETTRVVSLKQTELTLMSLLSHLFCTWCNVRSQSWFRLLEFYKKKLNPKYKKIKFGILFRNWQLPNKYTKPYTCDHFNWLLFDLSSFSDLLRL